jgi:hypothetical protein
MDLLQTKSVTVVPLLNNAPLPNATVNLFFSAGASVDHTHNLTQADASRFGTRFPSSSQCNSGSDGRQCVVQISTKDISAKISLLATSGLGGVNYWVYSGINKAQGFPSRLEDWGFTTASGRLFGEQSVHPNGNHWCQTNFCEKLVDLATLYEATWGQQFYFNDLSLHLGGRYDVNWDKGFEWTQPHQFHQMGLDADIKANGEPGSIPTDAAIRGWIGGQCFILWRHLCVFEPSPPHLHIYGWR